MRHSSVLIADGHQVVIEGIRQILDGGKYEIVGAVSDGLSLVKRALRLSPDVIIAEIALPSQNGIEAARQILALRPKTRVIFLTVHTELPYLGAALALGVCGYVTKYAAKEELLHAIRSALKGRSYVSKQLAELVEHVRTGRSQDGKSVGSLTRRQLEVLKLLTDGRQVKEIAAVLKLSPKTVEYHKYKIMKRLGVKTVPQLVHHALRYGILS
jgi:DNA-binding NarL/FixJ family response regulator